MNFEDVKKIPKDGLYTRAEIGEKAYHDRKESMLRNEMTKGENTFLGYLEKTSKAVASTLMFMRYPKLNQFRISRLVMERIDINPSSKLVYAVLASFVRPPQLRRVEIAGLCGLSVREVDRAIYDLVQYRLIKVQRRHYTRTRRAPNVYRVCPLPEKFRNPSIPVLEEVDMNQLEQRLRHVFRLEF